MSPFGNEDVRNIEDGATEEEYFVSIQRAINSGMWSLQGFYGRSMMAAIQAGKCMLGTSPARDYFGNRIPSRTEVKEGTKGSFDYVVELSGEEWARKMREVK